MMAGCSSVRGRLSRPGEPLRIGVIRVPFSRSMWNIARLSPMAASSLDQIPRLYHFTDRRNLDLIRQHGGLHPMADLGKRGVKVPAPGGNEWSRDADGLKGMERYVHLCFRSHHPME
jgi:hypothetical protein